jgi:hypothetical protein
VLVVIRRVGQQQTARLVQAGPAIAQVQVLAELVVLAAVVGLARRPLAALADLAAAVGVQTHRELVGLVVLAVAAAGPQ